MKIIAEFEDIERGQECQPPQHWFWGLGDDSKLYFRWQMPISAFSPFDWSSADYAHIPLYSIMKIAKEFERFWKIRAFS